MTSLEGVFRILSTKKKSSGKPESLKNKRSENPKPNHSLKTKLS